MTLWFCFFLFFFFGYIYYARQSERYRPYHCGANLKLFRQDLLFWLFIIKNLFSIIYLFIFLLYYISLELFIWLHNWNAFLYFYFILKYCSSHLFVAFFNSQILYFADSQPVFCFNFCFLFFFTRLFSQMFFFFLLLI